MISMAGMLLMIKAIVAFTNPRLGQLERMHFPFGHTTSNTLNICTPGRYQVVMKLQMF
jgi:hypothetical protein